MYKLPSVLIAVSLMLNFGVLAHEAVSGGGVASKAALNDDQAVQIVLKRQFDKPGAPLKVAPVSIEGGYAVAGWLQEQRGGRALLKKEKNEWSKMKPGQRLFYNLQQLTEGKRFEYSIFE